MVAIINCPRCKKRFTTQIEPPKQISDEPVAITLVCPGCTHEFQFCISGFPAEE